MSLRYLSWRVVNFKKRESQSQFISDYQRGSILGRSTYLLFNNIDESHDITDTLLDMGAVRCHNSGRSHNVAPLEKSRLQYFRCFSSLYSNLSKVLTI